MRENFKPAGEVVDAFFSAPPSFINTNASAVILTKTQKAGLAYEKRAQSYLGGLCGDGSEFSCICSPWVCFRNKSYPSHAINFCQPDVLLVRRDQGFVIVCEVKLSHTADSWKQLRQLYEPVLRHIYPRTTEFALLEICKWFDPQTSFPETFYFCEDVLKAERSRIGIHIHRPRGRL